MIGWEVTHILAVMNYWKRARFVSHLRDEKGEFYNAPTAAFGGKILQFTLFKLSYKLLTSSAWKHLQEVRASPVINHATLERGPLENSRLMQVIIKTGSNE